MTSSMYGIRSTMTISDESRSLHVDGRHPLRRRMFGGMSSHGPGPGEITGRVAGYACFVSQSSSPLLYSYDQRYIQAADCNERKPFRRDGCTCLSESVS